MWFLMVAAFAGVPALSAQEETSQTNKDAQELSESAQEVQTPAEKLAEYQKQFAELNSQLSKKAMALQKEMADADQEQIMQAMTELQEQMKQESTVIARKVMEVAACGMEDLETSLEAIGWVFTRSNDAELHKAAGQLLLQYHVDNPQTPAILSQVRMPTQTIQELFEAVIAKSQDRKIQAEASLGLIDYLSQAIQMAPALAGNEQVAKMFPEAASYLESVSELDEDAMLERMKKLDEEYGDVELENGTIREMIARKIKAIEIRNSVKIGKVAPDIEGPDIDGENFKLSDYRGKVVMLDFWGDW